MLSALLQRPLLAIAIVLMSSVVLRGLCFAEKQPEELSVEAAFKAATKLMEKQDYKRAIPYLVRVQSDLPVDTSVLWNLGLAYAATGDHSKAVETWKSYRRIAPDDWPVRAKLVQSYQALGETRARDEEIKSLY